MMENTHGVPIELLHDTVSIQFSSNLILLLRFLLGSAHILHTIESIHHRLITIIVFV